MRYLLPVAVMSLFLTLSLACAGLGVPAVSPDPAAKPPPDPGTAVGGSTVETQAKPPIQPSEEAAEWGGQVTFVDEVNLRTAPSTEAEVVAVLPIRTDVQPLEIGTDLTLFGLKRPWIRVRAGEHDGWLWSGMLTGLSPTAGAASFVVGLRGATVLDGAQLVSVEVAGTVDGQVITPKHVDFRVPEDWTASRPEQMFTARVLPDGGYPGLQHVVRLGFSEDFCGGRSGNLVFAREGSSMVFLRENLHFSDVPIFYTEALIFPVEQGGRPGRILLKKEGGEHGEDDEDVLSTDELEPLVWRSGELLTAAD